MEKPRPKPNFWKKLEMELFNSVLKDETITITGNKANIKGKTTLKAKVYGTEGEWTLPTDANFKKIDGKWLFCN